jgi:hypothetical protein
MGELSHGGIESAAPGAAAPEEYVEKSVEYEGQRPETLLPTPKTVLSWAVELLK